MERTQREEVLRSADLLLNVSGSFSQLRDYDRLPRLVFIDSDPVFTQVKIARGQRDFKAFVDAHDVHFTFGESMGEAVPDTGHRWIPTRQPVVLDEWSGQNAQRSVFTTIMNWSSYKPVEYSGTRYEQKDVEFMRFVHLPEMVAPATLELALNAVGKFSKAPLWRLRQSGILSQVHSVLDGRMERGERRICDRTLWLVQLPVGLLSRRGSSGGAPGHGLLESAPRGPGHSGFLQSGGGRFHDR
jgi:hypothetical protein